MSEKDDFISFEKALRDLKLKSEELRKLVSEGEIRAFRDGPDSMKFRREDIETLASKPGDSEDLIGASGLEDDTGMVTEQLSSDDTLIEDAEPEASPQAKARQPRSTRAPSMAGAGEAEREPAWVTAVGIVAFLLLFWGFLVSYSISQESDPAGSGFTSMFADKK